MQSLFICPIDVDFGQWNENASSSVPELRPSGASWLSLDPLVTSAYATQTMAVLWPSFRMDDSLKMVID